LQQPKQQQKSSPVAAVSHTDAAARCLSISSDANRKKHIRQLRERLSHSPRTTETSLTRAAASAAGHLHPACAAGSTARALADWRVARFDIWIYTMRFV